MLEVYEINDTEPEANWLKLRREERCFTETGKRTAL